MKAWPCVDCGALTSIKYKVFCREHSGFWEKVEAKLRQAAWFLFVRHQPHCEKCIALMREKWR